MGSCIFIFMGCFFTAFSLYSIIKLRILKNKGAKTTAEIIEFQKIPTTDDSPQINPIYEFTDASNNKYKVKGDVYHILQKIGDKSTIYYNPSNPVDCKLQADFNGSIFTFLIGIAMLVGGIYIRYH